jgi:hypothetical protein
VADAYLESARGFQHNAFKIELAKKAIVRGLREAVRHRPHPSVPLEGQGT